MMALLGALGGLRGDSMNQRATDRPPETASTDRRTFLRGLAAVVAAAGVDPDWTTAADERQPQSAVSAPRRAPAGSLVGVQMGPHTMLDEGIGRCLDLIKDSAAI